MKRFLLSWGIFIAFFIAALVLYSHPQILEVQGKTGIAKVIVWMAFLAFVGYSYHCSRRENLFRTIRTMNGLYWGRQIGTDLYIGVALFLSFIYLHEGSIITLLFWLVPTLLFANLATLLYVAIHLESILARFVF
jgi:hypothetical protein